MKIPATIKWRHAWEALFVLLIAALVWHNGMSILDDWHGPAGSLTNDLFIPAIMMNAGHGFATVDPSSIPPLRLFLDFQTQAFDTTLIPHDIEIAKLHPYQEFHRYLIYSVAFVWRFTGVTWDGVKLLILLYFFLSCLAVYGICRLVLNPALSLFVVVAFIYSPSVSLTLPILRDFAKAPFILSTAMLLAIIAFKRLSRRNFLIVAGCIGMLLGVGMGIRRDMMVFLPISILFLFIAPIKSVRYTFFAKLLALALLMSSFILAGWPVHKSFIREGYLAAHDTIMGFSSFSDHELGLLEPASYEKHYLLNDMYSTIKAHYAAGLGVTFPKDVYQERAAEPDFDGEVKRAYVQSIVMTFPADMLARAYAAVMRTTTGITPTPFGIEKYGLWFTCIALLLIAAQSPFRAGLLLILLCYFCGYTSIQFAARHAFHTSFVPFFFLAFLLQHTAAYLWNKVRVETHTGQQMQEKKPVWQIWRRAAAWALLVMLLFTSPFLVAKQIQKKNIEELRSHYAASALDPVAYKTLVWNGQPLIAPTESLRAEGFTGKCLLEDFDTGVLVASFDDVNIPLDFRAVYEWEGGIGNFGGPLTVVTKESNKKSPATLYLPVHEMTNYTANWSRFVGLSMSEEAASAFRGLYKIHNLNDPGLLVNLLTPEDNELFIYSQKLTVPWYDTAGKPYTYGSDYHFIEQTIQINACLTGSAPEKAVTLARKALEQYPGSIINTVLLVEALELAGKKDEAHSACHSLLETFPQIPAVYAQLNRHFEKQGGSQQRKEFWSTILAHNPSLPLAAAYQAAATADMEALLND